MDRFRQWGIFDAIAKVSSPERLLRDPHRHRRPDHEGGVAGDRRLRRDRPTSSTAATSSMRCSACCPRAWCTSATSWRPSRTRATASVLTFANGETVEADLVVGADGIKSVGARAAVQRQGAGVLRRARLPRGDLRRRRLRHGRRRQPADVHRPGHEGLPAAAAPPQPGVLRHHRPDARTAPGRRRSRRTTCWRRSRASTSGSSSITRDLDMDAVNVRAVYDIDPVDTWHSDSVALARRRGPRDAATTRARARTRRSWTPARSPTRSSQADSVKEALALYQADPQAGDRRAAAHLAPGLDRGRGQRRLPRPEARVPEPRQAADADGRCTPRSPRSSPPCRRRLTVAARTRWPCAPARTRRSRPSAERLPLHAVEDTTAPTPSGDVPVRIYTPAEADAYGAAGVLPRRRVLPRQPGHPRPRRAVPGQGDRAARSSPSATGWRPRPPSRPACEDCYARGPMGRRAGREPGLGRRDPRHRRRQLGRHLRRRRRRDGPRRRVRPASPTRSSSTRRWTWTSTSTATPRCGRTPWATGWRRPG